jgi:class 3 adenylate cyclase
MKNQSDLAGWLESSTGEKVSLGEKCIIGRAKDCQIVAISEMASRRHAMIYRQGENEFWLADLGSANGTRLNGRHVSQHRKLTDQDKIEFGGQEFVFRQPGAHGPNRRDTSDVFATIVGTRNFNCWLLVADMVGSTVMARKLPEEEAVKVTRGSLVQWKNIVEIHHGIVNKFLGDGFLAYWPDGEGVVRQVLEALESFKRLQSQSYTESQPCTPFRLVLHYGAATSGGAPSMGEESLTGREVNFAFRMEDLASTVGTSVLLSESAVSKLGTALKVASYGRHGLAGFSGNFEFFSF